MSLTLNTSHTNNQTLTLNIHDYPGGVAIWGALPAIFDTSNQGFDRGVHVHARLSDNAKKSIDATYQKVEVIWREKKFVIDEETAVHFTMASIFDVDIISLACQRCHNQLISTGVFAVTPHRQHQCQYCKQINLTTKACVINPVIALKKNLGDYLVQRQTLLPKRRIALDFNRYSGGIQIWGSNPSIIWTAKRLEESAIHVHAYDASKKRIVDNTYSEVTIADTSLNIEMIRVLQIQQAVPNLISMVTTVCCPCCGAQQFDQGIKAVIAHTARLCPQCKTLFEHRKAISNPAAQILRKFKLRLSA